MDWFLYDGDLCRERVKDTLFGVVINCTTLHFEKIILSVLNVHLCSFNGCSFVQLKR